VVYVHPFHNFSICKYDPAAVSVVTASAVLAPSGGAVGDDVTLVGLSSRLDSSSSAEIVRYVRCLTTYLCAFVGDAARS
jgi:hypothetical protein